MTLFSITFVKVSEKNSKSLRAEGVMARSSEAFVFYTVLQDLLTRDSLNQWIEKKVAILKLACDFIWVFACDQIVKNSGQCINSDNPGLEPFGLTSQQSAAKGCGCF